MTQQVLYVTASGEILDWQDTSLFNFGAPASDQAVLKVTSDQWASQGTPQYVANGALVSGVPPQNLTDAQSAAYARINAGANAQLALIIAAYPELEVATWDQQLAEAQAYTANDSAATPLLSAISAATGATTGGTALTVAQLAANVLAKDAAYKAASGAIIGKRVALSGLVAATTTSAAADAINWS